MRYFLILVSLIVIMVNGFNFVSRVANGHAHASVIAEEANRCAIDMAINPSLICD